MTGRRGPITCRVRLCNQCVTIAHGGGVLRVGEIHFSVRAGTFLILSCTIKIVSFDVDFIKGR